MKVSNYIFKEATGWNKSLTDNKFAYQANFVLVFGTRELLENKSILSDIQQAFPNALIVGGSTAGEIEGTHVFENSIVLTVFQFEKAQFKEVYRYLESSDESYNVGLCLANALKKDDLKYVMVLSDGLYVNGTELVKGLRDILGCSVIITGGLVGDYANFARTSVVLNQNILEKHVLAIGFYGDSLKVGFGSMGGWDAYGLVRRITSSKGNILYEMDHKPALDIYKMYLGERAKELPASGLLFPLSIRIEKDDYPLVRTILGINEKEKSIIYAGAVPEGAYAQFMKANFNRIVDGATLAATLCCGTQAQIIWDYALLISCVGRKLVLTQRIEEETEAVKQILGEHIILSGFYSYGEICPIRENTRCELHNQSMTITTFSEQ